MRFVFPARYNWQVRIHRDFYTVKDILNDYFEQSEIAFVFQHDADNEVNRTHCHSYMFKLNKQRSTIDGYLRKRYKGNEDFSVSQTCGKKKRPVDVLGAWCYGTTKNLISPSYVKGLTETEQEFLMKEAKEFWDKMAEAEKSRQKAIELVEVVIEKEKKDSIWLDYYGRVMQEWKKGTASQFYNWSYDRFKRWITADYLNKSKAPPRIADRNRYAYGLFILNKHGFMENIDADFISSDY